MPEDEDEDDPFEAFETPADEVDDDPFEDLQPSESDEAADDGPTPSDPGDPAEASSAPGRLPDDPFDSDSVADAATSGEHDSTTETAGDDADHEPTDDPFAEFSAPRRDDDGDDPFEAFESAGVDGIDPDVVWEDLASGGGPQDGDRTYAEVSKHRFCEGCEHFSTPPEIECTYDGAAIVEFLDTETVRLLNCPVVAEQRALEGSGVDIGADSE